MSKPSLEQIFTYHPPFGDQPERYVAIRAAALTFARLVQSSTPPSREQSLALTTIQEAVMWANSAIAVNEEMPPATQFVSAFTVVPPTLDDGTDINGNIAVNVNA